MKFIPNVCWTALGLTAMIVVSGCGEGASTKPTVVAKPRADSVANSDGPKTDNGKVAVAAGIGTFKGVIKRSG